MISLPVKCRENCSIIQKIKYTVYAGSVNWCQAVVLELKVHTKNYVFNAVFFICLDLLLNDHLKIATAVLLRLTCLKLCSLYI